MTDILIYDSGAKKIQLDKSSLLNSPLLDYCHKMKKSSADFIIDQEFKKPRAVVFDFDGSFIEEESMSELAKQTKNYKQIKEATDSAMSGSLNYKESLRFRMKHLAGTPLPLVKQVAKSLTLRAGVKNFLAQLTENNIPVYIVSSGFEEFIYPVVKNLDVKHVYAHRFPALGGRLNGEAPQSIIDGAVKKEFLLDIAKQENTDVADIWVFVDGSNDQMMAETAGLSIGCKPKECLWPSLDGFLFSGSYDAVSKILALTV